MTAALRETNFRETEKSLPILGGEEARPHVVSALSRGLPELTPAFVAHDGHFVIVGSGPSLPHFVEEIRAEREKGRPICAVKGAHDFLIENGIVPELFITTELQDRVHQLKRKNKETVYLLASRVNPVMFDHLEDCNVLLWHSWAESERFSELNGKTLIGGGTTTGLRAVTVGYVLGFRRMVLYGFDSCVDQEGKKRFDSGVMRDDQLVDRWIAGRRFLCNHAMALQADEFQQYFGKHEDGQPLYPDLTFDVKGDGLIAAIIAERRKLGRRT